MELFGIDFTVTSEEFHDDDLAFGKSDLMTALFFASEDVFAEFENFELNFVDFDGESITEVFEPVGQAGLEGFLDGLKGEIVAIDVGVEVFLEREEAFEVVLMKIEDESRDGAGGAAVAVDKGMDVGELVVGDGGFDDRVDGEMVGVSKPFEEVADEEGNFTRDRRAEDDAKFSGFVETFNDDLFLAVLAEFFGRKDFVHSNGMKLFEGGFAEEVVESELVLAINPFDDRAVIDDFLDVAVAGDDAG